jgi:hypothetical protein
MSSRVTCSCGWSWNKSDSSKKDMYVCHQCGKDNTMKDGGWLSKYNDIPEAQTGIDAYFQGYVPSTKITKPLVEGVRQNLLDYIQSPLYKQRLGNYSEGNYSGPYQDSIASIKQEQRANNLENVKFTISPIGNNRDRYVYNKHGIEFNNMGEPSVVAHELGHSIFANDSNSWIGSDSVNSAAINSLADSSLYSSFLNDREIDALNSHSNPNFFKLNKYDPHFDSSLSGISANESYADLMGVRQLLYENGLTKKFGDNINKETLKKALENKKISKNPTFQRMRSKYNNDKIIMLNNTIAKNNDDSINDAPLAQNGIEGTMGGLTDKGFNYNGAWGGTMQMGGSLPGSVGFTYARTQSPAPSNGKYAKKTKASAQHGENVKPTKIQKQRYNQLYPPLIDKIVNAAGDDYNSLPFGNRMFIESKFDGLTNTNNRNLPPIDPIIKEVQNKILALPQDELNKLLKVDWRNISAPGAFLKKPKGIGMGDMFRYINHFKKLKSQGYTLQNGGEMKYYQEGLDWKPKSISRDGSWLSKYEEGGIIEDDMGQWAHPGEITKINSNQITMQGVDYPVLGISDTGDTQMMYPDEEYTYDGESVTEIPMAQKGRVVPLRDLMKQEDEKLKAKSDNTKVVPQKTISNKEANALRARKDAEELARRKQAIAASNKVNDMSDFDLSNVNQYLRNPTGLIQAATSTPLQFITSLVNKEKYTPENFAIATGAVGDKARLFPNDPNSFFDDYLNPLVQVGNMASNLGRAPLDIQQGNYGSAALSVATPFLTGVGEQYLSNAIAPYLPARGQVASELKDLKKAVFPTKPTFINPSEQELLSTVRNVGILSKTGANDASVLEKILAKGSGLTDDEFQNLLGSSRSEIQGKIQILRETPTGAKKVGENQFEWDVNPNANQSPPPILDANGNPISTSGNLNLNRPATSQAARDSAFIRRQGRQQGRQLQNLYNQAISQQGGRDLSPQQMNALRTFVDDTYELIRTDPDNAPNFSDFINHPQYQDLYNFKLEPNKSFIRGLTNRINEARYLPISSEQADSLLPNLYRNESNNPAAEIIKAYRTLERAPKGSTFRSAGSLSTDSYPATLRMTEKAINNDLGNLNYTGMSTLNPSGFSQTAGIPTDINLREMNTLIDQLNKKLIKPIPYAYQEGTQIFAPQISVTRKKNGGWLNKYE